MEVKAVKTRIVGIGDDLTQLLYDSLPILAERSIVVVTSKIVALCQQRVVRVGEVAKPDLIAQEADFFMPAAESKYGITLSIKDGVLIPTAGIDESNGNGWYILWPTDVWSTAQKIRRALCNRFHLRELGVVITDSKTTPLRRGTTGVALSCSGLKPIHNYVGQPDIFQRPLHVTQANIIDGIAAAAVLVMGEGNEQTPLAVVSGCGAAQFVDRPLSSLEKSGLTIPIEEDLYAPLVQSEKWIVGQG